MNYLNKLKNKAKRYQKVIKTITVSSYERHIYSTPPKRARNASKIIMIYYVLKTLAQDKDNKADIQWLLKEISNEIRG